jgi:hypothetical protein
MIMMNPDGLLLCSRYAYPPNSLSLCGPEKQKDLKWYTMQGKTDTGTREILSAFSTLYPYLSFIAYENNIKDPFEIPVIEAYWLGNHLLSNIPLSGFSRHLKDNLKLKKKITPAKLSSLLEKLPIGGLPNHAFHVLNIYKRTGHLDISHSTETMDACIINYGKIEKTLPGYLIINTKPLRMINDKLQFDKPIKRKISLIFEKHSLQLKIKNGDWVSYHWGMFCQKLNSHQLKNLIYYNNLAVSLANIDCYCE